MCRYLFILLVLSSPLSFTLQAQNAFDIEKQNWIDQQYKSMNIDQQLGQLFMVAAYSNKGEQHIKELELLIEKNHIGGLIFFQGGPMRQAHMINRLQQKAKVPLLIGIDGEWGLAMRLDSTISFPKQMTLGAIQNDSLIYAMGAEVARQCKLVGVHINFAPVVDVNSNPLNPVIGYRAFGESPALVAKKAHAYMRGMQDHGILANAKHFPGHGDTDADSHYTLPVIKHDQERIKQIDLFPYKMLFDDKLASIMVAHLYIPAFDDTPNKATTLSKAVVTDLLKEEMGFKGLIFTDALNMKGVSSFYEPGEVDYLALKAGNDVMLFTQNVPNAIARIKKGLENGDLDKAEVEKSIKKILAAKYDAGLNNNKKLETDKLYPLLQEPTAHALNRKLYESAATVIKNEKKYLPIRMIDTTSFASLSLRAENYTSFQKSLGKYAQFQHFALPKNADGPEEYTELLGKLSRFETVVVGIHNMNNTPNKQFGINRDDLFFLKQLAERTTVVINVFGNAYALKYFEDFEQVICLYEDNAHTRAIAPQVIFGAIPANGKLPISISAKLPLGSGYELATLSRLGYSMPESVGMDSRTLKKIDAIAEEAIRTEATPGMQVLVARNGKVIFNKNYGYQTYEQKDPIIDETLYDLASITKVAATVQALMLLEEWQLVDLDLRLSKYFPELKDSNKKDIKLREILLHQAGLLPYIPYWKRTVDGFGFQPEYYNIFPEEGYENEIIPGLYGHTAIKDSIWKWSVDSSLLPKKRRKDPFEYKYSDMGYYVMQRIIEEVTGQPLDAFLHENIYSPLGAYTLTYNPLCKFNEEQIAPTEEDIFFRKTLIRGVVHDQGAAMFGGVAGHAGLFSSANDLAKLMQMNLWDGEYGGIRYFQPGTVPYFAGVQIKQNRRGLGWDKPVMQEGPSPTSRHASQLTFGHTGFTGTAAWADPEFNLIYIFLSNRIHPDADNRKLITSNIRTRIQDVIYESIFAIDQQKI